MRVATKLIALQRSQWWTAEKIREFQERKLLQKLKFAATSVAYYRSLGIRGADIVTAADLQRFPILSKQMQQSNQSSLLADGVTLDSLDTSTTSGSTGEPTTVAFDRQTWLLCKYALKVRRLLAFNIGVGKRVLQVSELHPQEIATASHLFGRDLIFGQRLVSIHDPVHAVIPVLREYRPHAIYGLPSFLAELLEYCERHGESLPKVDVIFTSSEVLGKALRKRLVEVFGAFICDVYGSTEFKEVAWQCELEHYHINFESTWVEIDESIESDGSGAVLLTTLVNRAMPLIEQRLLSAQKTLLMIYAGLLARYDKMDLLQRLRDKVGRRDGIPGLWLLVPGDGSAMLDGKAIPILGAGQQCDIPLSWIKNTHRGTSEMANRQTQTQAQNVS